MIDYFDIYLRRLNAYGNDPQSRMQGKRQKEFDLYLQRSVYRVTFDYNNEQIVGSFERYKQDETRTLHYLLVPVPVTLEPGTILQLPNIQNQPEPWMVYYLEEIKASGYNRYIMLRMTHHLAWKGLDGAIHESWAYLYGQENHHLRDEIQSHGVTSLYSENNKSNYFIMPLCDYIKKDIYISVGEAPYKQQFRVTGYDIQSSPGVEYVTIDPIYEYDLTPAPQPTQADDPSDFFWFNGN